MHNRTYTMRRVNFLFRHASTALIQVLRKNVFIDRDREWERMSGQQQKHRNGNQEEQKERAQP